MSERLVFGAAIGAIESLLCSIGNRTPHRVSTFPDGLASVALAALMYCAVLLHVRRYQTDTVGAVYVAGGTIAMTAGLLFGTTVVLLGVVRFSQFSPSLSGFGFATAFASALVCGTAASAAVIATQRGRTSGAAMPTRRNLPKSSIR